MNPSAVAERPAAGLRQGRLEPPLRPDALSLYLDQLHWVSLARALVNDQRGLSFRAVLQSLTRASMASRIAVPLSEAHYIETWNAVRRDRRLHLASVMSRTSRFRTIAPIGQLVFPEARRGMAGLIGRPIDDPPVRAFGTGIAHALGQRPEDVEKRFSGADRLWAEYMLLASPTEHDDDLASERQAKPDDHADVEQARQQILHDHYPKKADREHEIAWLTLRDAERQIFGAAISLDLGTDGFRRVLDDAGVRGLLREIPSLWVLGEMRRLASEDPNYQWRRTDRHDLRALSVAMVYCDVVVTERHWAHHLRRGRIDTQLGTVVLTRLADIWPYVGVATL